MKSRLAARILWLYTRFVGATSRLRYVNSEHEKSLQDSGKAFIYVFWHGRQAMMLYVHRGKRIAPLISSSKDGELAARLAGLYRIRPERGSSRRGVFGGLRGLIQRMKNGDAIALTPDGPLGPERGVKPGVLALAQRLRVPILPMSASFRRKIIFKGWDTFWFPLPFNVLVVNFAPPFPVEPNDAIEVKCRELQGILNNLTGEADALADPV